ncbi:hypothetical protein ACXVUM_04705 [Williamsia sp. SKLECPSW1]
MSFIVQLLERRKYARSPETGANSRLSSDDDAVEMVAEGAGAVAHPPERRL